MNAGPVPVFPQGANPEQPYDYVAWPAWRYHPEPPHKGTIFNTAEEVPSGFLTLDELNEKLDGAMPLPADHQTSRVDPTPIEGDDDDGAEGEEGEEGEEGDGDGDGAGEGDEGAAKVPGGAENERVLTDEQQAALSTKLQDEHSQKQLVAMITAIDTAAQAAGKPEIEFASNWGKKKLADLIAANGGPLGE